MTPKLLAMALLLPGGHLGGLGGSADGVGGPVEGAWAPPIVRGGLRWGLETGEIAHLLHPYNIALTVTQT